MFDFSLSVYDRRFFSLSLSLSSFSSLTIPTLPYSCLIIYVAPLFYVLVLFSLFIYVNECIGKATLENHSRYCFIVEAVDEELERKTKKKAKTQKQEKKVILHSLSSLSSHMSLPLTTNSYKEVRRVKC